jgi:hypothetical protein
MFRSVVHTVVLSVHVAAGVAGLILGPVAMLSTKWRNRRHMNAGALYHWVYLVLFVSSVALALLSWDELWWLALIGAFSYSFALMGYLAAKRRWREWLQWHVAGQGGSYVAMVTALLVVNSSRGTIAAWLLPTVLGSPAIAWVTNEVARGRRPRRRRMVRAL